MWLIRSANPDSPPGFILLVGIEGGGQPGAPWVNASEAAGWQVYPWDFDMETPRFFEALKNGEAPNG